LELSCENATVGTNGLRVYTYLFRNKNYHYEAFRHVETVFVQGKNLVPSRPAIGWQVLFTYRQPIEGLLGTRFPPWTKKVSTYRKAIYLPK